MTILLSLINPTFWIALVFLVCAAMSLCLGSGGDTTSSRWSRAGRVLRKPLALVILGCGTLLSLAWGIYLGYASPRDILQDIVSADEFLHGRPMYQKSMTPLVAKAIADHPPTFSLGRWWPGLSEWEAAGRKETSEASWVQAHPPGMSLLIAPLVAVFGYQGAFFVFGLISLIALAILLRLIRIGPAARWSTATVALVVLLVLGWDPVVMALRNGQTGILLATLLVLAWYALRQDKPVWAGIAVAVAACIKVYPAYLLVYFFLRNRRAFASGAITGAILLGISLALAGKANFLGYQQTAAVVIGEYAAHPGNMSLLGLVSRTVLEPHRYAVYGKHMELAIGLIVTSALSLLLWRSSKSYNKDDRMDLEYATVMICMMLLSPICWQHYLPLALFPLAVLAGRVLQPGARPMAAFAFFLLLGMLSIPDEFWVHSFRAVIPGLGVWLGGVVLLTLPCMSLASVGLWLASLTFFDRSWLPATGQNRAPAAKVGSSPRIATAD